MACPKCGNQNAKTEIAEPHSDENYPDVEFQQVAVFCPTCKQGFNCIGTKKLK